MLGYRGVLISNTMILGVLLMLFATIGLHTPVWFIVMLAYLLWRSSHLCNTQA